VRFDTLRDFFALAIRPDSAPIWSAVCLAVPTAEQLRRHWSSMS
jgi:hypothetical protein